MAIYPNVLNEYKHVILDTVRFDDVIDDLIAKEVVDEKQYLEIWSRTQNQIQHLVNFVLKDASRCRIFIEILSEIPKLADTVKLIQYDIDQIRKVIVAGEFPDFPLNYVVRNSVEYLELADTVRKHVLKLEFGITNILVIHGAPGFGKSYLVNQVLQTKDLVNYSGDAMFWINLGEHQNTTNIIYALWRLYLNIAKCSDRAPLQHCPEDVSVLTTELRKLLQEQKLKNSILILDDVKSPAILDAFKVCSKIIVTTQDKDVANASTATFIPITTGFTQKESIELLSKSLDTKIDFIKEAEDIHQSCSGCPMLVNIIASILKDSRDEALASADLWNEILQEISHTYSLNDPTTEKVMCMIQKCVDRLSDEIKRYFLSLSVFGQHVNIKTIILLKLWNLPNRRVRSIMQTLEHKSLVVSFFNSESKSYVYSIHSLVYTYLVNNHPENIRDYHIKLLSLYDDITNQTPFDDPISQYILGYYGYHAKHARMWDKFQEFFKLEFIERKIKYVGSADLLTDYTIYKDLITGQNAALEEKLEGLKKITTAYSSHLHTSPETNIIQYVIMFEHSTADIYSEAYEIARHNHDRLYFKLYDYSGKRKTYSTLKHRDNVTTATFLDGKKILVGSENGDIEIKFFDQYDQKAHRFEGHQSSILNLIPSPDGTKFLSISHDQTTKLWKFERDLDPQSPKCKQFDWRNMHSPLDDAKNNVTFKMDDSDFIISAAFPHDNSNEIVTGSYKGKLIRWDTLTGARIKEMPERGFYIPCILFTHNSAEMMFCCNGKIFRYTRKDFDYQGQLGSWESYNLLYLVANERQVIALGEKAFEIWDYERKQRIGMHAFHAKVVASVVNKEYLVLATESYRIFVYNLLQHTVQELENECGLPNALFLSPLNYVAFIHFNGNVLQRHQISLKALERPKVQNIDLFAASWRDDLPYFATVKNQTSVDVYNGNAKHIDTISINKPITFVAFSRGAQRLILGAANGSVYIYNVNNQNTEHLKVFDNEIVNVQCYTNAQSGQVSLATIATSNEIFVCDTKERIAQNYNALYNYLNYFVAVDARGVISAINIFRGTLDELIRDGSETANATTATSAVSAFNAERLLLAVVCCNETNKLGVYAVDLYKLTLPTVKFFAQVEIDARPTSLCFSFDGQLVAVGRIDGAIEVFYIEAINQEVKKRVMLNLHKSVEKLLFAPYAEPILVSVGDQVAWWNLSSFQNSAKETNEEAKLKRTVRQLSLMNIDWKNKKTIETVPYLLNSTNLYGRALKFISASNDFKYFLIVDSHGSIFKMDLLT